MNMFEHRVPPPVVALLLAAGMGWAAGWTSSWPWMAGLQLALVGGMVGLGLLFDMSGLLAFVRRRTTVNPLRPERATALVTDGIYRFTRNPMYVGMCCVLLAWALYLWSPQALLGPAVFVAWITRFQIVPEERVLEQVFGDEFRAYRARVRRWI
ncbi:MAG: isoprenylcysteine carboxylmethyltransferase family protein [Burkholderiaceae bacterium]